MDIQKVLQSLGLNDKEIQVYLAILPLGSVPASMLGKRTGITRSTAQYTCQQLEKKGLIKAVKKNNTFIYSPEPPEKLSLLLNRQKQLLTEKEENIKRIISDLNGMINPSAILPKVNFYEGTDGIENAYDEMIEYLKPEDEVLSFTKTIEELPKLQDQNKRDGLYNLKHDPSIKFIKKRVEKKIRTRVIATFSKSSKLLQKDDSKFLRETRLVEEDHLFCLGGEIFIIKDRIYAMSLEKQGAFMFMAESKSLTQMFKVLFELAWKQAGK